MNSIRNPKINAAATLKSLSLSGFPASSMVDLYSQIKSVTLDDDADSFHAIFDEMQTHGDVPHDRSILSPAAYLLDLLRMVKSVESPETPFHRTLLGRRPDLSWLTLDDVQTNTMTPYLRLVNDLIQTRIEVVTDFRSHEGLVTPDASPLLSSLHVQRAKAYLASAKIDLSEITAIFGSQEGATAARLGLSVTALRALTDHAIHLNSVAAVLPQSLLVEAIQDKGLPWLLALLGCDSETVALACGPDVLGSMLARSTALAVGDFGEGMALAFVPASAADWDAFGKLWSLAIRGPDESLASPAYGAKTQEDADTAMQAAYAAISETLRFSRAARALGLGARAFDDLLRSLGSSLMLLDDLRRAADVLDLAKRFELDIAQATLLFGGNAGLTMLQADGTPPLFLRLFPLQDARPAHLFFCIRNLEPAKAAAAGLTVIEAHQALHFRASREIHAQYADDPEQLAREMNVIESWQTGDGNTTLAFFYRLSRLSRLLSRSVTDLLTLAHLLNVGLDDPDEITALVDYSDWLTAVKISPAELMALAQDNQVATCVASDALAIAQEVQAALLRLVDKSDKSDNANERCLLAVLADRYGLDVDALDKILKEGMDQGRSQALVASLLDGSMAKIDTKLPLPASLALLGLSDLQSGVAVAGRFPIALKVIATVYNLQRDLGYDHELPSGWRNLRNLRSYDRLQGLAKTRKTDVLADFETCCELSVEEASDAEMLPALARLLDLPEAVLSTLISNGSATGPTEWLQSLTLRLGVALTAVATLERAKILASSLARDLPHLQRLANLVDCDNQAYSRDVITDTVAALAARSDEVSWHSTVDSLETQLLESERDVTVAHLIWLLNYPGTSHFCWLDTPAETAEEVSDLLLVDVQMGGASKISPLKLALNSAQRYIQRVLGGNEGSPPPFQLDKNQWTWRAHYRLWEANRKVFLFPENFLDPGLRRQKTPLFRDLEDALLQTEISDDAVMLIYKDYFDKLEDLSKLEFVAGCVASVYIPGSLVAQNTFFFLGRTAAKKPDYFIRAAIFDADRQLSRWQPWEKVNFPLHSREAALGYVNNRLHLFWLEERTVSEQIDGISTTSTFVTLRFSYKLHGTGWLDAQTYEDFDDRPIGHVTRAKGEEGPTFDPPEGMEIKCPFPNSLDNQFPLRIKAIAPSKIQMSAASVGGSNRSDSRLTARLLADLDVQANMMNVETSGEFPPSWAAAVNLDNADFTQPLISGDPFNGYVAALAVGNANSPTSAAVLFALTTHGGRGSMLAISEYDGNSWRNILSDEQRAIRFSRIYTAAKSRNVYLQGLLDASLYRIMDFKKGTLENKKITLPGPEDNISLIDVAISDDGMTLAVIIGTKGQDLGDVYYSQDAGDTWNAVSRPSMAMMATSLCFDNEGALFVAFFHFDLPRVSVTCTQDFGLNWQLLGDTQVVHEGHLRAMTRDSSGGVMMALCRQLWRATQTQDLHRVYTGVPEGQPPDAGQTPDWNLGTIAILAQSPYGWLCQMVNGAQLQKANLGWHSYRDGADGWKRIKPHTADIPVMSNDTVSCIVCHPVTGTVVIGDTHGMWRAARRRVAGVSATGSIDKLITPMRDPVTNVLGRKQAVAFSSTAVHELSQLLLTKGLDALLSLHAQTALIETAADDISKTAIDFRPSSAFSAYYSEVFFHIPYLIADTLNREGKFEEAQRWYHHVFRPQRIGDVHDPADKTPFWRYVPFKSHDLARLNAYDPEEFAIYESDPFDAHAIAGIRMGAYEKAVIMRYIDNLIDWGDQLFAQNNWESNTLAMSHYQLAADLLGPDPRKGRRAGVLPATTTYAELYPIDTTPDANPSDSFHLDDQKVFPIPQNDNFAAYWDRTRAQMAKIRSSQDIHGIKGQLALFQPPIDPRQLMMALASGQSMSQAIAETTEHIPIYRFEAMLARARTAAQNVISLSGSLLSTLEKKDAEGLALLRARQERQMLEAMGRARDLAMTEAQARVTSVGTQQAAAANRQSHFQALLSSDLLPSEQLAMNLKTTALVLMSVTARLRSASAAGYAMPSIFGLANGGQDWGRVIETAAVVVDANASAINQGAGLAESRGQNDRRREDWSWQLAETEMEISRIAGDLAAANLAVTRAQLDLDAHQQTVIQAEALAAYMDGKFTNDEIYGWLSGRLTSLVAQSFKIALSLAQDAQWSLQWERCLITNFITPLPANNLHSSLLAGEELLLNLAQMEKKWLDTGKRQLEVERTISLQALKSDEAINKVCKDWTDLRLHKQITINLIPELIESDGAGPGYRRLRSVAVTIPAIVGPYQSLNAILKQTSHTQIRDKKPVTTHTSTCVVLSRGVADHGVFDLDFKSDHYQPFEGTGAVSEWELSLPDHLPEPMLASISDVVIHLRYVVVKAD